MSSRRMGNNLRGIAKMNEDDRKEAHAERQQKKFRVEVMNNLGEPLCVFLGVIANTKHEAETKAKAALLFQAEREK